MEIPIKVVSPDLEEKELSGDGWKFTTEEYDNKETNEGLSILKDLLNE